MDSGQFDRLVRSLGQRRSRRQTVRGLAGAGAFVALLGAKPVAAGKPGKPNKAPKNSGKGQPGNSPPGSGQNGPLGGGPLGQPGPSPLCLDNCQESFEGCAEPCDNSICLGICQDRLDRCKANCPNA